MAHTTGGSEKTDGGKRPRARSGGGRGQGQSLWIDLCVPTFPLPRPRAAVLLPLLLPPPQSPGSHTLNSSHWALAWDAGLRKWFIENSLNTYTKQQLAQFALPRM